MAANRSSLTRISGIAALALFSVPAVAATGCGPKAPHKASPADLLLDSMKECRYNVCALIDQRNPFGTGWQRVKIDRDRSGRVHKCVLQPLRVQGIESIDDGVRWQTILPDEGMIIDQESPSKHPCDDALRCRLAKLNYKFTLEGNSKIAGRAVFNVVAWPVHPMLAVKHYSLDAETLYPLEVKNVLNGAASVEFVTLDISYPKAANSEEFQFHPEVGMRVVQFGSPSDVRTAADVKHRLGFEPLIPRNIPLGFQADEVQVDQDGTWQALVIRLTDGLCRATVYEYLPDQGVRVLEQSSSRDYRGVRLLAVCPLGEAVRKALLDGFSNSQPFALRDASVILASNGTRTGSSRVGKR